MSKLRKFEYKKKSYKGDDVPKKRKRLSSKKRKPKYQKDYYESNQEEQNLRAPEFTSPL